MGCEGVYISFKKYPLSNRGSLSIKRFNGLLKFVKFYNNINNFSILLYFLCGYNW